jgi:hypothetical protein
MRLTIAVIAWTVFLALLAIACVAWVAIRYANDTSCASIGSTCSFDNDGLLRFAVFGVPAAWVAGLAVILVWRNRSTAGPKRE